MSVQLREIKEQLAGMDSRIANYFMATLRAIADEGKNGPRLFTFRTRETGFSFKPLIARPLALQLWCEAEGCQHPVIDTGKGLYPVDIQHEWVKQVAPYASFALKVLATVAPIAAPSINTFFGPDTTKTWKIADQLIWRVPSSTNCPLKSNPQTAVLLRGKCSANRSGLASSRFIAS